MSMMQDRVDEQHTLMMHGVPSATPPPALLPVSVLRHKDTGRVRWEPAVEETHGGRTLSRTEKDRAAASPEPPAGTAADQAFAMVLEKERKQQGVLRSQVAQLMQQVLKLKDEQQKLQQTAYQPVPPTASAAAVAAASTKQDVDHLIRSSTTSTLSAAATVAVSAPATTAWPQAL